MRVGGSLIGSESQSEDVVDNLLGIENEPIDEEQAMETHLVEQLNNDDGIGNIGVTEGTADDLATGLKLFVSTSEKKTNMGFTC